MPGHQQHEFVAQAQAVQPQQIAPQIGAGMQMDVHRVAGQRAQEQAGGPDRQRLARALQRQPVRKRRGHQPGNIRIDIDAPDFFPEPADRRRLILAGALAQDAAQQPARLDQGFDLRQRRGDRIVRGNRMTGHVAHHRPHQQRQIFLVEHAGLEGAPHEGGKNEVVIVMEILGNRHAHQEIEGLDRRHVLPEPLEQMVRLIALAARDRHQERRLGRVDPAGIERRELQQLVRPHRRVVYVLVRQRHVLQDRDETLLAVQAPGQLRQGIETRQRVQRAAVMAGRHFGRAGHREGRGRQHGLDRQPGAQSCQGAVQDLRRRRVLDELHQRFDVRGILDAARHRHGELPGGAAMAGSVVSRFR